jgi:hypothetical protein
MTLGIASYSMLLFGFDFPLIEYIPIISACLSLILSIVGYTKAGLFLGAVPKNSNVIILFCCSNGSSGIASSSRSSKDKSSIYRSAPLSSLSCKSIMSTAISSMISSTYKSGASSLIL